MQLPIDVKALIDEMTDIEAARNTPLSVSVFIDEAAPADLAAHVRNAFASTMPSVRMTVSYLDDTFMPHPTDDVAVIAAGEIGENGEILVEDAFPEAVYEARANGLTVIACSLTGWK